MGSGKPAVFDLASYTPSLRVRLGGYAACVAGAVVLGALDGPASGAVVAVVSIALWELNLRIPFAGLNRVTLTPTAIEVPPNLALPPFMRRGRTLGWPSRFVQYRDITAIERDGAAATLVRRASEPLRLTFETAATGEAFERAVTPHLAV